MRNLLLSTRYSDKQQGHGMKKLLLPSEARSYAITSDNHFSVIVTDVVRKKKVS